MLLSVSFLLLPDCHGLSCLNNTNYHLTVCSRNFNSSYEMKSLLLGQHSRGLLGETLFFGLCTHSFGLRLLESFLPPPSTSLVSQLSYLPRPVGTLDHNGPNKLPISRPQFNPVHKVCFTKPCSTARASQGTCLTFLPHEHVFSHSLQALCSACPLSCLLLCKALSSTALHSQKFKTTLCSTPFFIPTLSSKKTNSPSCNKNTTTIPTSQSRKQPPSRPGHSLKPASTLPARSSGSTRTWPLCSVMVSPSRPRAL